jgi:hypothetical protein
MAGSDAKADVPSTSSVPETTGSPTGDHIPTAQADHVGGSSSDVNDEAATIEAPIEGEALVDEEDAEQEPEAASLLAPSMSSTGLRVGFCRL